MPRYKPSDCHALMLPVVLSEQIVPGSFAFALSYRMDQELDLSARNARFKNDITVASADNPRVMLKIVLLAYSQYLIGREMFAIDGVKLPCNVSKEHSGTHEELSHRAERLDKAADKILALHQAQDKAGAQESLKAKPQACVDAFRQEAARTRAFVAQSPRRLNSKNQELKSNITASGQPYQTSIAKARDCGSCALRSRCIKTREADEKKSPPARGRQVSRFLSKAPDPSHPSERMRQAIVSPRGRQMYSQRIGTVEPVFANLRHNKRLSRFNYRGQAKVRTQWSLYCMVHNIEKLSETGVGQDSRQ